MLDDGLLRRFSCLAMVSKDYKSESRTIQSASMLSALYKRVPDMAWDPWNVKAQKRSKRENKHFISSSISEYGHTCFKVSFKINSSLTTGTCMYICKWVDIQKLKLMRLYTHTSLYCKSFQKSFFYMSCYVQYVLFIFYKFMYSFVQKSVPLFSSYIYMYNYWIHEACMCKCL